MSWYNGGPGCGRTYWGRFLGGGWLPFGSEPMNAYSNVQVFMFGADLL
jgi:hypothetical protein